MTMIRNPNKDNEMIIARMRGVAPNKEGDDSNPQNPNAGKALEPSTLAADTNQPEPSQVAVAGLRQSEECAMEPKAMIRQLRDANRDDPDLVRLCNETLLIFRNLQKADVNPTTPNQIASKNMRAKLRYNMNWLANWKRKKLVVVTNPPL